MIQSWTKYEEANHTAEEAEAEKEDAAFTVPHQKFQIPILDSFSAGIYCNCSRIWPISCLGLPVLQNHILHNNLHSNSLSSLKLDKVKIKENDLFWFGFELDNGLDFTCKSRPGSQFFSHTYSPTYIHITGQSNKLKAKFEPSFDTGIFRQVPVGQKTLS